MLKVDQTRLYAVLTRNLRPGTAKTAYLGLIDASLASASAVTGHFRLQTSLRLRTVRAISRSLLSAATAVSIDD